jgi:hypothetical protein
VRPSERHVASIVPRIAAFAMCLQFRVKRYSIWWSGGNADVKCIDGCFLRERPAPHKFLGKSGGLVGHCQGWNSSKRLQPASTCAGIPESCLVPNDLRDESRRSGPSTIVWSAAGEQRRRCRDWREHSGS